MIEIDSIDSSDFKTWKEHPITDLLYYLIDRSYIDTKLSIIDDRSFESNGNLIWYLKGMMDVYYKLLNIDLETLKNSNEENFYDHLMEEVNEWNE